VPTVAELERETVVPIVVADATGLITKVNRPFLQLFGWSLPEVLGEPVSMIIPPELREAHHAGWKRFLATSEARLLDKPLLLKAVDKAGRQFMAEHYIVAERREGQWVFAATVREVTPRSTPDSHLGPYG